MLPQRTIQKLGEVFETKRMPFGFGPRVEVQAQTLVVTPNGPAQQMVTQQARGWQFVREAAPGAVLEALVLAPEGLVYENVEYVRWAKFWARASEILVPIVDGAAEVTDLKLFSLEFFDRFVFAGDLKKAVPTTLIEEKLVSNLPSSTRNGSELWHIHRGWYETVDGIRVLINQNIDANDGQNAKNEPVRIVGLYTKVERRNREEIVEAKLLSGEIQRMHSISKAVFADAITADVRKRIGLHDDVSS